ncbi:F-box only protein 21-like [Anoplolepis gracilipes]|uniref:F-box only protein 21-like n=1 Tax=Anoplolepis gracilipes TaxID=354296 RepID=UPI003BA31D16
MAMIMRLPEEVINIILGCSDISIEDIINFRCVCKKFRHVAKHKKFMENKFLQRWPTARKHYNKHFKQNEQKDKKSLNFIKMGIYYMRLLQNETQLKHNYSYYQSINKVMQMGHLCGLDVGNMSLDYKEYKNERKIRNITISFKMDEIKSLLTLLSRTSVYERLTDKYHSLQLLIYLRQLKLKIKFNKFMKQTSTARLLENCATFVAQLLQPQKEVFYSTVTASLDSMATDVLNNLREKHPGHSILSTSADLFFNWRNNNSDDNYWTEVEGTQIMDALDEYIFDKLNFRPYNPENIEWNIQLKYKCIDHVLEHKYGREIVIYIIYHSVARRLGLRCDIVRFNQTIYLFWKPSYATNSLKNVRCFEINSNQFPDCLIKQERVERFEVLTVQEMKEILLDLNQLFLGYPWSNNRSPLRVNEYDIDKVYNYKQSRDLFKYLKMVAPHYCFMVKIENFEMTNTKSKKVKFAVGTIVTHGNQSTDCSAGVIIGWHRYKERHLVTFYTVDRRTNPNHIPLKFCSNTRKKQTHYLILTEKNEMCYVGEDSIALTKPKLIENDEVGRYFDNFDGKHYVPNRKVAERYPHNAIVTAPRATEPPGYVDIITLILFILKINNVI